MLVLALSLYLSSFLHTHINDHSNDHLQLILSLVRLCSLILRRFLFVIQRPSALDENVAIFRKRVISYNGAISSQQPGTHSFKLREQFLLYSSCHQLSLLAFLEEVYLHRPCSVVKFKRGSNYFLVFLLIYNLYP